jgi:hypothetical protein
MRETDFGRGLLLKISERLTRYRPHYGGVTGRQLACVIFGVVAGHVLRTAIGHLLKLNPPDLAAGGLFIDGEGNSRQTDHANAIMTAMKVTSLKH